MSEVITMYHLYKGDRPAVLSPGAILFIDQKTVMHAASYFSFRGIRDFHPLRVEVSKHSVSMMAEGVFVLLNQVPTLESEEFT